jgi:hypothetical protein
MFLQCHRQLAGRIYVSEENLSQREPAVLPGIPGVNQAGDRIDPFLHVEIGWAMQDDDRSRILGNYALN